MTEIVYVPLHAKITPDDVREIRRAYAEDGVKQKELAAKYNLTVGAVSHIIRRRTWNNVK